MYDKYATEALVLRTTPVGDSDLLAVLYTRAFGLVRARVRAGRTEKSKMRAALATGMPIVCALIRGRAGWKLAGAEAVSRALPLEAYFILGRTFRLCERLVQGEEEQAYLYDVLIAEREGLATARREDYPLIELLTVARLLHGLGYLSIETLGLAQTGAVIEDTHLRDVERRRAHVLGMVNSALAASQL